MKYGKNSNNNEFTFLQQLQCDGYQGYFCRPTICTEEFERAVLTNYLIPEPL